MQCVSRTVLLFFFQAEDGIRDKLVTGVQTCALPISPATVAVVVVVIGRLVFVFRLDQVGGVEKGALFRPDVDERGLYPRKHGLDRAEVDIAHHAAGVRTIHQELNKAGVLQDRDASLACGPADENFPFQSKGPRPRSARRQAGSHDCSSKNSWRGDRLRTSWNCW